MTVVLCPLVVGALVPLRSGRSVSSLRAEAGGSSRRPRHFSLLRQSKVPKRKATRSQGHFVVPCAARARWGLAKLASLKQTRALIHLSLRCSALPHGKGGIGCGRACERADEISCGAASSSAGGPVLIVLSRAPAPDRAAKQPRPPSKTTRRRCAAAAVGSRPHPPVGHGEQRRLGRIKGSRLFERSEFSETPPKLSSAADPAQQGVHVGSPFFAYFLWRDKESEAPAGAQSRPPPSNKASNRMSEAPPMASIHTVDAVAKQQPSAPKQGNRPIEQSNQSSMGHISPKKPLSIPPQIPNPMHQRAPTNHLQSPRQQRNIVVKTAMAGRLTDVGQGGEHLVVVQHLQTAGQLAVGHGAVPGAQGFAGGGGAVPGVFVLLGVEHALQTQDGGAAVGLQGVGDEVQQRFSVHQGGVVGPL